MLDKKNQAMGLWILDSLPGEIAKETLKSMFLDLSCLYSHALLAGSMCFTYACRE
jgi:hypothetical protein